MQSLALSLVALAGTLAVACASPALDDAAQSGAADSSGRAKTILDCNVFASGGGPDQEVTVLQNADGSLTLKELTEDGDTVTRALTADEWNSADIKLRHASDDSAEAVNRLYKDSTGDWMYEAKDDGFAADGNADCRR